MGSSDNLTPERRLMAMRIIVSALLGGLAIFAGVAVAYRYTGHPAAPALMVLTYVSIVFTGVLTLCSAVVPAIWAATARRGLLATPATDESGSPAPIAASKWYEIYQSQLIISAALLEGPAFLALIAFLIEGSPASLGLALFLFIMLALKMPSGPRIERWISNQQQLLEREREEYT